MNRTSLVRSALVLTTLVALAIPATASADPAPTRLTVSQTAFYVSGFQINLEVSVTCTPGFGYFVNASVIQPQGFAQVSGNGSANGLCTGQHQKIAVPVFSFFFPGWQLGDAAASVTACALGCDSATRNIKVDLR
jgi:hypothetical protein